MKKENSQEKRDNHSVSKWRRVIAVTLSILMMTSIIDYSDFINVSAHTSGDKETITSFVELPENISNQKIAFGTSESDINLPDTLLVTVKSYVQESSQTDEESSQDASDIVNDEETVENADNNLQENEVKNNESDYQESEETHMEETSKDITLEHIVWNINTTASKCDTFDSSIGGAVVIYEPVLPEEYALEEGLSLPQIKVQIEEKEDKSEWDFHDSKTIDGVEITVKAEKDVFPEGAILHVDKVTDADNKEKIENAINNEVKMETINETIEELIAFDITITDADGNELQPDTSKGEVKVSFAKLSMTENEATTENCDIQVFHMNDDLNNAEKLESSVDNEGVVETVAEHFSVYAITETINTPDTSTMTTLYIDKGNITIGDGTVSGYDASGIEITTPNSNGYIITQNNSDSCAACIKVNSGTHNIVLKDVNYYSEKYGSCNPFSIASGAKVNLVLEGTNRLQSQSGDAGLHVPNGAEMVIAQGSTGSISTLGGTGAGIGGNDSESGGTITINGGYVSASSNGSYGAGIGGGRGGDGGIITINGGTITNATSSNYGAGIGGGFLGDGGIIIINGGMITKANGGNYGAGIGGGCNGGGGNITINGGTITEANGGNYGAGIGGGCDGDGGTITISSGKVTATSSNGAGIGGGCDGDGGSITINGGVVNTNGGRGAGIGGGCGSENNKKGDGGTITISNGEVTATSYFGAGIGGGAVGENHTGGIITISGGTVTTDSKIGIGIGNSSKGGIGGTLSSAGNFVFVNAKGVNADTSGFNGVIENDGNKTVYGSYTLSKNIEIASEKTMTLSSNSSLIVPNGKTLTVNGTLNHKDGTYSNNGILTGIGTLIPKLDVNITRENSEIAFADRVELNTLFTIPNEVGSVTYTLEEGGTGVGGIADSTLTVIRAGTFFITVNTAATRFYNVGSKTVALTILKSINGSDINIVPYSETYDGANHNAVTVTGMPSGTNVTYCTSKDGIFSADCPKVKDVSDTGKTYYVKISGDEYNTWTSAISQAVNITPFPISYSGITATGKTYDGTTVVGSGELVISGVSLKGVLDADKDDVSLSVSNAQYESKNAGNTKIFFKASLMGAAAGNYRLQSGLESGSVNAVIEKKQLDVALTTEAQEKAYFLQLGDSMPHYTVDDLTMTGFVNDESETTAGIDSKFLHFILSPNDTNSPLTNGIVTIRGLYSTNYYFSNRTGLLRVGKKVFDYTPYIVMGNNNAKSGNDLWYNGTINITPNVFAGNFIYINSSTDGGSTWQGWGTSATISTDTNESDVKIKLATGADGTGAVLISGDATTSNLKGVICRLDTTAPSYPDSPADTYGIKVKNSWWRSLLNTITFGNFFEESQVVSIMAKEEGSGIAGTYFYKEAVTNRSSYTPLSSTQLDSLSADKWSSSCTVAQDGNYVVYAYTADKAGNKSAYICTDGLVQKIKEVPKQNEENSDDQAVTVSPLKKTVKANETIIGATDKVVGEGNDRETGKPFIQGEVGVEGWDVIKERTLEEKEHSVTVEMNGVNVVPGDVLEAIKGKDITYVFDMGNGISWSINGQSITADNVEDIDLKVIIGTNAIPAGVISSIAGENDAMNISLAHDGTFGFTAVLTVNMKEENAGRYANLFYYNEQTGALEFISVGKIGNDGNAELVFTHASEYTILVADEPMDVNNTENKTESVDYEKVDDIQKVDTPAKEDGWNPLWLIMIGAIVILIGGVGAVVIKRKGKEA